MLKTPDLSSFRGSFPKPNKKEKKPFKPLSQGKKVQHWNNGRKDLKVIFRENGIVSCEIFAYVVENNRELLKEYTFSDCKPKFALGFAHIKRRKNLTDEEIINPHFVVLADQICHDIVDFKMPKEKAEALLENIVKRRGW